VDAAASPRRPGWLVEVGGAAALLFWGLLVIVADFGANGFDLIADTIGAVMVLAGVHRTVEADWPGRDEHTALRGWLLALAIVDVALVPFYDYVLRLPPVGWLVAVVQSLGAVLLARLFVWMFASSGHDRLADEWRRCFWVLVVVFGPLQVILYVGVTALGARPFGPRVPAPAGFALPVIIVHWLTGIVFALALWRTHNAMIPEAGVSTSASDPAAPR
jgi:hypothetical protein